VPEHSATSPAQSRYHRILAHWRGALLCLLVIGTFMMPVSYRAGTDSSHPHTIFQVMVDAIAGQTHSHGEGAHQPERPAPSPFAPLSVPLTALTADVDPAHDADTPIMLHLSSPISATAAIQVLGLIVASLLLFSPYRHAWALLSTLRPVANRIETPPPRPA
jgi:hypothetical protein